ncbi:LuxR family two component transcriptional regulator [Paractinoplanes brasiliensis]|uniref:LuxR family two component transcriptional regulator n=2 Tax=Paractinoplanes brasiliensis TaxID=52695 RepID=A0A4R6JRZ5_9ACTN|nr:LuxR family two component transcriptional regulator [Actinoplanes brasiliensis]GID32629.1 DNA-binding response regulator [Actinoplanes brasiliensis]
MTDVRVMVVDDQALIREGIASLLGLEPGIEVVGTAADGRAAVEVALTTSPDVVLMDVRMPVLDGVRAAEILRARLPSCRVLMLTTFDDEEYVLSALRAGTSGYLLKNLPARELAQAVRLAHAGVDQHDASVVRRLAEALDRAVPARGRPDLTDREIEVLRLIARGATNREIASQLYVSEGTVKNHVSHILSRLGLRDRTQAALYARENGLL